MSWASALMTALLLSFSSCGSAAAAQCSQQYCTAPDGKGGYHCLAGSKYQACSCSQGVARVINEVPILPEWKSPEFMLDRLYNYTCCTNGTVKEEQCGDFIPASDSKPAAQYLSISEGDCSDHGYMRILSQAACKAAALEVGLPEDLAEIHAGVPPNEDVECMVDNLGAASPGFTKLCQKDTCLKYNTAYGSSIDGSHCADYDFLKTKFFGRIPLATYFKSLGMGATWPPLADAAACRAACLEQPGCEFYTFVLGSYGLEAYSPWACYLYPEVSCPSGGVAYGYSPDYVSGHRNCTMASVTNATLRVAPAAATTTPEAKSVTEPHVESLSSLACGQWSSVTLVQILCASFLYALRFT